MKIPRAFLLLVLPAFLLAPSDGRCESKPAGMAWLKIGVGADAVAKGNAVVSNVDGPGATYWNPGALALMTGTQYGFAHNESFQSIRQEFAGAVRNFGRVSLAGSFHGTWTDNMESYDSAGNYLGQFGYYGLAAGVTGGYSLNDQWGVGLTAKYVRESLDVFSASGMAYDLGVQGREVLPRLSLGMSVLHLGSTMKYVDTEFQLPLTIQGGASYRMPLSALGAEAIVAAELRKVRDEDASLLFGIEYRVQQIARLRFGYRSAMDNEDVSFGVGLRHKQVEADYSYVPFKDDLGAQHRIGLTVRR
jgi:hypothetical protein